jgi:hypothetical protein
VDRNLTLTIDEELLRAARRIALDRNTSVNRMVREYLAETVRGPGREQTAVAELDRLFRMTRGKVGKASWTRDDLHER